MALLMLDDTNAPICAFERQHLNTSMDEDWLQERLFQHPELIPRRTLGFEHDFFVPICRELAIPKLTKNVFLDLLYVTGSGRLVLVECKL